MQSTGYVTDCLEKQFPREGVASKETVPVGQSSNVDKAHRCTYYDGNVPDSHVEKMVDNLPSLPIHGVNNDQPRPYFFYC
jgi:hypothetical protein